ncbi:hypothetical protein [Nonomuraea sp. LPB2021202275-12-8]|uniref:hypothetical protein n=1 Tax=Nonomuraea sp. LPB2021202275-12-8 TaxID=3120159 RepID=UPI00300C9738
MSDILLNDGREEDWVTVEGRVLRAKTSDFMLDSAARRTSDGGSRRALVHDSSDGLTVNFNGDYPGGVTINEARLNLRVSEHDALPKNGKIGDLVLTHRLIKMDGIPIGEETALWLCVGVISTISNLGKQSVASWRPVSLGEPIQGTA